MTLDDVMAEAIRLTRSATNDDVSRFIAAVETYGDKRVAEDRQKWRTDLAEYRAHIADDVQRGKDSIDATRYRHIVDEALIHEDWLRRNLRPFQGEDDYVAAVNEAVDKSINGRCAPASQEPQE